MNFFQIAFPDFGLVEKILRNILVTILISNVLTFVQRQYPRIFGQHLTFFFLTNNIKLHVKVLHRSYSYNEFIRNSRPDVSPLC